MGVFCISDRQIVDEVLAPIRQAPWAGPGKSTQLPSITYPASPTCHRITPPPSGVSLFLRRVPPSPLTFLRRRSQAPPRGLLPDTCGWPQWGQDSWPRPPALPSVLAMHRCTAWPSLLVARCSHPLLRPRLLSRRPGPGGRLGVPEAPGARPLPFSPATVPRPLPGCAAFHSYRVPSISHPPRGLLRGVGRRRRGPVSVP